MKIKIQILSTGIKFNNRRKNVPISVICAKYLTQASRKKPSLSGLPKHSRISTNDKARKKVLCNVVIRHV